jgi:hypothetical protein
MNKFLIKNINGDYYRNHVRNTEYTFEYRNNLPIIQMPIQAIPVTKEYAWIFRSEECAATVACLLGLDWEVEEISSKG